LDGLGAVFVLLLSGTVLCAFPKDW